MSHSAIDVNHPVLGRHKVRVTWNTDEGAALLPSYVEGSIRCPDIEKCRWTCKKREHVQGLNSNASDKVYSTLQKELRDHLGGKHKAPKRKR